MGRECGECSECCITFSIEDEKLNKAAGWKCKHLGCKGCKIYDDKPKTCNDFLCAWKDEDGVLSEDERPDKVGAIFRIVSADGRGKGFKKMIMANAMDRETWQPTKDPCDLRALQVAERLAKHYPVVLSPSGVTIGPWDEEGNQLPSAKWVIDPEEAHRIKPKRGLSATEETIFGNLLDVL